MSALVLTAVIAFSCGFAAAALLSAGRRSDSARAAQVLAEAVDVFTGEIRPNGVRSDEPVTVARSQVDDLRRALDLHDRLHSA